jgi:hypothetical protein
MNVTRCLLTVAAGTQYQAIGVTSAGDEVTIGQKFFDHFHCSANYCCAKYSIFV